MSFLKRLTTVPKSIKKFQLKDLGSIKKVGKLAKDVALPAAAILSGGGLAGLGPLAGALGGIGGSIGGGISAAAGAAKGAGAGIAGKLGLGGSGGLGGLLGTGSKLKDALKLGGMVMGGKQMHDAGKQSKADSAMARDLAGQSVKAYQDAMQGAQSRYDENSALRDMFRQGTTNFRDMSNPFARPMEPQGGAPPMLNQPAPTPQVPPGFGPMVQPPAGGGMGGGPPGGPGGGLQQQMSPLMGMLGGGGMMGGTGRTASVKGPDVFQQQDFGRDRMQDPFGFQGMQ